jgi:hypothetical protein
MAKSIDEIPDISAQLLDPGGFESIPQIDVPQGRDGKHKQIVTQLLENISRLAAGSALKVPLSRLPDTKENIRAALSRAARQARIDLATSSNEEFLYVWKTDKESSQDESSHINSAQA